MRAWWVGGWVVSGVAAAAVGTLFYERIVFRLSYCPTP